MIVVHSLHAPPIAICMDRSQNGLGVNGERILNSRSCCQYWTSLCGGSQYGLHHMHAFALHLNIGRVQRRLGVGELGHAQTQ